MSQTQDKTVSFDDEMLILVDDNDQVTGYADKEACHEDDGVLHRAFSIFIFNDKKQLLMQKRSGQKKLWPLTWSNSCCSHPRKGETYEEATRRRLREELGFSTSLEFLFKFEYQANYKHVGSENELCSVFVGKADGPLQINTNEIAEWKYFDIDELEQDMEENPRDYTPWFKIEWKRIRDEFSDRI